MGRRFIDLILSCSKARSKIILPIAFPIIGAALVFFYAKIEKLYTLQEIFHRADIQEAKLTLLDLPIGSSESLAQLPDIHRAAHTYQDPHAFILERDKLISELRIPSRAQAQLALDELGHDCDPALFSEHPALMRDEINLDSWDQELNQFRIAGDFKKLAAQEYIFCQRLLDLERKFFFVEIKTPEEDSLRVSRSLPDGMGGGFLRNGRLTCVGFSFVTHAFLHHVGIRHRALEFPGHSAIAADLADGQSFLVDANYEKIVDLKKSTVINGYKTIYLGPLDPELIARPVDAEKGIRAAELSNLAAITHNIEANAFLRNEAIKLVGNSKGSTATAMLIEIAEVKVREYARALQKTDPSIRFYGPDWSYLNDKPKQPIPQIDELKIFALPNDRHIHKDIQLIITRLRGQIHNLSGRPS